jgi:uracil-DNA glycosylase family 4
MTLRATCPDECPRKKERICNGNIQGVGPREARIVLVSDYPNRTDDEEGIPLLGQPGRMLNSMLAPTGVSRQDIYITNAIKCFTRKEEVKTVAKELKYCSAYLEAELKTINPVVIGTLGAHALKAVLNRTGITKLKNNVFFSEEFNCKVVPVYHPNYVLRNPHEYSVLNDGIRMIVREAESREVNTAAQENATYLTATTAEQVERIITCLEKQEAFVFDLETSSLDYFVAKILCVSVSWKERFGAVIPWELLKSIKPLFDRFVALLQSTKLKINHNIKFDIQVLKGNKVCCKGPYFDTMLAHHLIDENTKHGLDELTLRYLDLGEYWGDLEKAKTAICKEKKIGKEEFSYDLLPTNILYPYAAKDADATFRLYKQFNKELDRQNLKTFFLEHTMAFMPVLMYMEFKGILINREELKTLIEQYQAKIEVLEKAFFENPDVQKYESWRKSGAMKKLAEKYEGSKILKSRYPNGIEEYAQASL